MQGRGIRLGLLLLACLPVVGLVGARSVFFLRVRPFGALAPSLSLGRTAEFPGVSHAERHSSRPARSARAGSDVFFSTLLAQSRWDRGFWGRRVPPKFASPKEGTDDRFTFARIFYESVRGEPSGYGWNTDYPYSDINFMTRFSELTTTPIALDGDGVPDHVVVSLLDETIYDYPFVFMSDVGTVGFSPMEVERLRDYLLRGGFLYVDDFWGDMAWEHWKQEIEKVLPPDAYPIVDVPLENEVFRTYFTIREVPQIPSIHFWRRSGGTSTSERGYETREPHFRGIFDDAGRLMVIMTHNTDIADGWEREAEEEEYFYRFSLKAYPVGINIAIYAFTH